MVDQSIIDLSLQILGLTSLVFQLLGVFFVFYYKKKIQIHLIEHQQTNLNNMFILYFLTILGGVIMTSYFLLGFIIRAKNKVEGMWGYAFVYSGQLLQSFCPLLQINVINYNQEKAFVALPFLYLIHPKKTLRYGLKLFLCVICVFFVFLVWDIGCYHVDSEWGTVSNYVCFNLWLLYLRILMFVVLFSFIKNQHKRIDKKIALYQALFAFANLMVYVESLMFVVALLLSKTKVISVADYEAVLVFKAYWPYVVYILQAGFIAVLCKLAHKKLQQAGKNYKVSYI